ncbi:MAG TPA: hypothetical protein V6D29_15920 [Leptolyngbyaceae cyanobacterium]
MRAIIKGQKNVIRKYEHEFIIAPLAYFKKTIQAIYEAFLSILFLASTGKRSFDDGTGGILFSLSFIVLCIVAFYLKEREVFIFVLLLIIFLIDKFSSRFHYLYVSPQKQTLLKIRNETTYFEEFFQGKPVRREIFSTKILDFILIDRCELLGGAFQERLDLVWRVCLKLDSQDGFIIFHHSREVAEAFEKASQISHSCPSPKPIFFANSVGSGEHVLTRLEEPEKVFYINKCRHTIKFDQQLPDKWSICSFWSFESYYRMISEIIKAILASLALVLTVNFMGELGGIFIKIIQGNSLYDILKAVYAMDTAFLPSNNLTEFIEIATISLAMLSKQLNISLIEKIDVSKNFLEYYLDRNLLGKLKTDNIKSVFLIEDFEPIILITDNTQFIEIPGLQTRYEFKAFVYRIMEAIEHFRQT